MARGPGRGDRISGVPDVLLHDILRRLHCLPAAARTSLLSRRWRRVWTGLPELVIDRFHVPGRTPTSFLRTLNGALTAYSASAPDNDVSALTIAVPHVGDCEIPAHRVTSWLRVASKRVAGTFSLTLPVSHLYCHGLQIDLPPFGRATEITLSLAWRFMIRLRPAGPFAALTKLKIELAFMDCRELEALVSTMCPVLTDLTLRVALYGSDEVSISSASLKRLQFQDTSVIGLYGSDEVLQRVEVAAPVLEVLAASVQFHAHISAPMLADAKVKRPHRYHFADDVPRRLRRLDINQLYVTAAAPPSTPQRFDAVGELRLSAYIGMTGYTNFFNDVNNLPMCDTLLSVSLTGNHHEFIPTMLHLLKRSNGIRKLVLETYTKMKDPCSLSCPCRLPESYRTDNINLDSLEEIKINMFMGADDQVEFLKLLLSRCSTTRLISVELDNYYLAPIPKEKLAEIISSSICHPNLRVRLHQVSDEKFLEEVL